MAIRYEKGTSVACHCGAKPRHDGGDYNDLCNQWPLCEEV